MRLLCEHLAGRHVRRLDTKHSVLEIRGRSIELDGRRTSLSPTALAVLRMLVDAGGAVVPKSKLQDVLPDSDDEHALEVAVGRLRQSLGSRGIVATVIKRGYRLDV